MKNTIIAVVLDTVSGDVTNWIIPTYHDKENIRNVISLLEHQYKRPVEVYHIPQSQLMISWNWGTMTTEQKTDFVNQNLDKMAYSTQDGFTEYGNSVIKEIVYDEE